VSISPKDSFYELIFRNKVIKGFSNENGKYYPLSDKMSAVLPKDGKKKSQY
jgi:hypothetical protein